MTPGKTSIVIAAHNEGDNLLDMVACILENTASPDFEVVVVDDGSTDNSAQKITRRFSGKQPVNVVRTSGLGVARARNQGARAASGDTLVFMDGHCYTPPGWLPALLAPLSDLGVGIVGPAFADLRKNDGGVGFGITWAGINLEMQWLSRQAEAPYAIPLLPGGCEALRKQDFDRMGGYDEGMTRWGSEAQELSLRAWLMGYEVMVNPGIIIYHLFREAHPYRVDMAGVIYNRLRMALLHFNLGRVARVFDFFKGMPEFSRIMTRLLASDVMARRSLWQAQYRHNDHWFLEKFGLDL
jgi:glycosyltransferase involved in cell wall biosynthesis